jgi:glutaconate CoA-transferase subunit A
MVAEDKTKSLEEAAAQVPSGCMLALGGVTIYRRPMAFVRALLKRFRQCGEPHDLTLLCFTAGLESDLLVGAGMVARVRTCYFGLEIFGLAPMFTYCANRGLIEIIEETEASIAFGLRAQMAGVGFMPARAWFGTDLPRLRPDVKTINDPYNGETYMAFPAIQPDVAVIHTLYSDPEGNATIGQNKGADVELAMTARHLIITSEQILPEVTRSDLIAPLVQTMVLAPGGAKPTSCHPLYPLDGHKLMEYTGSVSNQTSLQAFLDHWLDS